MRALVVAAFALSTVIGSAAGQSPTLNDWHLGNDKLSFSPGTTPGVTSQDVVHVTGDAGMRGWTSSFGVMMQKFSLAPWKGRRVRISLRLKDEGGMRSYVYFIAPAGQSMVQKQDSGAWQAYTFVTDVPSKGGNLLIDVGLVGKGGIWVEGVTLAEVSHDVALTATRRVYGTSGATMSAKVYYANPRLHYDYVDTSRSSFSH